MLTIGKVQLAILASDPDALFLQRLLETLRKDKHAAQMPPQELEADVKRTIEAARAFNLKTESEVAAFVVVAFLLGEDFVKEFPAARKVMTDGELSGKEKAAWLKQWTGLLFQTLEKG